MGFSLKQKVIGWVMSRLSPSDRLMLTHHSIMPTLPVKLWPYWIALHLYKKYFQEEDHSS